METLTCVYSVYTFNTHVAVYIYVYIYIYMHIYIYIKYKYIKYKYTVYIDYKKYYINYIPHVYIYT